MSEARAQAIEAQIRNAKVHHSKTGVLRRETLSMLIRSTHSASTRIKVLAATNIQYFFKDFPDLEEQAINAVYDLCEDQSPQVRIEGYRAISGISRAERRWVKRNADVLLQLLQSDEPEEVTVVKEALIEHLELDDRVTLGVLCDQLAPIDSTTDEEERTMRERLRTLVLSFLLGDALSSIARHAKPDSQSENILTEGILMALPYLDSMDAGTIVRSLTSALPSYRAPSRKGEALSQALLSRVSVAIRNDLKGGRPAQLLQTRPELQLVQSLVLVNPITSPLGLLRFYCNSLTGKLFLQQLARSEQQWLIGKLGDVLSFGQKNFSGDPDILQCQWKVVDACPYLLEVLIPTVLDQSLGTCLILLRTCLQRKNSQGWTVSPNLGTILEKMRAAIEKSPSQENKRDLQKMIMFLLPSGTSQPPQALAQPAPAALPIIRTERVMKTTERSASIPSTSQTSRRPPSRDQSLPPPSKKQKSAGDLVSGESQKLSLLSRLQPPTSEAVAPSSSQSQSFSIKGAATVLQGGNAATPKKPPLSLLDRLQQPIVIHPAASPTSGLGLDPRKRKRR